ncbi:MAG: hypothetical protein HFG02_04665 [Oscillibacter sp.]|nr:hypothetical protein [Oscillibacter sp.]
MRGEGGDSKIIYEISADRYQELMAAFYDGNGRTWFYQGEELDIQEVQSVLDSLRTDSFTSEKPFQKEEIRRNVYLEKEHCPNVFVGLYRYNGNLSSRKWTESRYCL